MGEQKSSPKFNVAIYYIIVSIARQRNKTGFHLVRWSVVDTVLHFVAEPRFSLYNRYSKDYFLAAVNWQGYRLFSGSRSPANRVKASHLFAQNYLESLVAGTWMEEFH